MKTLKYPGIILEKTYKKNSKKLGNELENHEMTKRPGKSLKGWKNLEMKAGSGDDFQHV